MFLFSCPAGSIRSVAKLTACVWQMASPICPSLILAENERPGGRETFQSFQRAVEMGLLFKAEWRSSLCNCNNGLDIPASCENPRHFPTSLCHDAVIYFIPAHCLSWRERYLSLTQLCLSREQIEALQNINQTKKYLNLK